MTQNGSQNGSLSFCVFLLLLVGFLGLQAYLSTFPALFYSVFLWRRAVDRNLPASTISGVRGHGVRPTYGTRFDTETPYVVGEGSLSFRVFWLVDRPSGPSVIQLEHDIS